MQEELDKFIERKTEELYQASFVDCLQDDDVKSVCEEYFELKTKLLAASN